MNLIDQKLKGIPSSDENRIYAVLTEAQRRMGHSDFSTTQRYSRFRETRNIGLQAQSDFELHLQTLAENYVYA